MKNNNYYDSQSIKVLEGLEAVRKRPGMYIGSTDINGLHHLVWEIIDNSIDEVLAGFCDKIDIIINENNSITIIDNGRGIPIDIHPTTQISTLETVFTFLHSGGKFDTNIYKISGGLHGVGASVVNALSSYLKIEINRKNKKYVIEFHKGGKILNKIKTINLLTNNNRGTSVTFIPDQNIFKENIIFDWSIINNHIKTLAFLNKGLTISIHDRRYKLNNYIKYKFNNGIIDYLATINQTLNPLTNSFFYIKKKEQNIIIECSLQYNCSYVNNLLTFCNNIHTKEGGTHEEGIKQIILKALNHCNKIINKNKKNNNKFTWDDVKEGLTCILSLYHPNPQYVGQTKTKLSNYEIKKIIFNIIGKDFNNYLLENLNDSKKIINKINLTLKSRIIAQQIKDNTYNKIITNNLSLPGKLTDCETKDSDIAELFIVEGNSAGGSAKSGRDRKFQAILPLKGKILNVEKAKKTKILKNNEIISIIKALGCGIKDDLKEKKLRYHKIIIMTDADIDGAHIRILLLTFFYRYMKKLITNGYIYIAQPPLYKIEYNKNKKYLYSDNELNNIKIEYKKHNINNFVIQRYKGLGEMNPEQLWETTMKPKNRLLYKVSINNCIKVDNICNELMGENVEPRKQFIKKNAKYIKNLDI